jgi:hypothetical protein
MENHLSLSRPKDVRPPVKIAKVDERGKTRTYSGGGMGRGVTLPMVDANINSQG